MNNLCKHGRLTTAYCTFCAELGILHVDPITVTPTLMQEPEEPGGDAEYYDLPPGFTYNGRPARLHDVIVACDMGWNQSNIFKAAYRWDKKPDLAYNLRKIIWYAKEAFKLLK